MRHANPVRRIATITLLVTALLIPGCNPDGTDDPVSISLGGAAQMRLKMEISPALGIDSGTVTISKGELVFTQQLVFEDNVATVLFDGLQPGLWLIDVELMDEDGNVLYTGSGEAEVTGGQISTATIVMEELTGNLEVIIELPPAGAAGLIAYYPFSGSADDHSGNGHDGTVFGATLTDDRFGNPDSAYLFDGVDDYIFLGQTPDFPAWDSYTVAVWIRDDGTGEYSDYGAKIIDKTIMWHDWYLTVQDDGQIVFFTYEDGPEGLGEDTYDYRDSLWHLLVVTKSGSFATLYIDGQSVDTTDEIRTVFSSGDLLVGYCESDHELQRRHFGGAIDDIRIYDGPLTAAEILDLYAAPTCVIADYRFDTPAGEIATDSSGNNNDGTLIGFADLTFGYGDDPANPGYTSDGRIRLVREGPLEYIETPIVASTFFTKSFTIEAITGLHADPWFWQPLVGYVLSGEAFVYWGAGWSEGALAPPHWHIDNGGPWLSYPDYDTVLTDGAMHHYAMAYDATAHQLLMYLDYELIATDNADLSNVVPAGDSGLVLIGSHAGIAPYEVWHGLIDRIRFSDIVVDSGDFIPLR